MTGLLIRLVIGGVGAVAVPLAEASALAATSGAASTGAPGIRANNVPLLSSTALNNQLATTPTLRSFTSFLLSLASNFLGETRSEPSRCIHDSFSFLIGQVREKPGGHEQTSR